MFAKSDDESDDESEDSDDPFRIDEICEFDEEEYEKIKDEMSFTRYLNSIILHFLGLPPQQLFFSFPLHHLNNNF